jgi:predicted house-cleaning noncanonical NTP pyrophosphatase (MazG superfamily)
MILSDEVYIKLLNDKLFEELHKYQESQNVEKLVDLVKE